MIITEINKLQTICEEVETYQEGEEIATHILKELNKTKTGIGLAANQIGINKQVCVINVKEPIILVNPKIVETSEEQFVFPEGCLSFPNKHIRTNRFVEVTVESSNHDELLTFSANSEDVNDAFECACVQHEIDHLNGITMFDREWKQQPIVNENKIGRNDKCHCGSGKKYKKCCINK